MQRVRTIEYEIDQVSFSIDKPQTISIQISSEESYLPQFIQIELKDEDLQLSKEFCEVLKKRLLQNLP